MHPIRYFNAENGMTDSGFSGWMFGFFRHGGLL
jgi:hypothetical protein